MSVFLGTHQNRFDAKGRVSIPAAFRNALRAQAEPGASLVILRPSHLHPCIEAWPQAAFASLAQPLGEIDVFSDAHDDLAASLYADAYPIDSDKEGRIIVPDSLRAHAGLRDEVAFMGLGRTFQIWEPEAAARRREDARSRSRAMTSRPQPTGAAS
ncbi:division/cell wall cluster transcriptional repressor MraZ [Tanticharoenia sakaeratensis]|uniref:Transcriptional regulator MraZ n=1 Tax=Tanticharoenia sakaeratensis NBRC 103193 TaxID=1231623 RepID=A0A0D6MNV0_9PROT|nr:division/cell wall cluster transcriptional repressor MraZ [Tanticharoenia sakaeratensis]GAN55126.1 cell division protein MraZ [Tanticharoenia sakaeratensis NBRC 103193]GBQ20293.1 cell division protein MraZ [Tanticharoenia sakaeratensis NBRC 103193]